MALPRPAGTPVEARLTGPGLFLTDFVGTALFLRLFRKMQFSAFRREGHGSIFRRSDAKMLQLVHSLFMIDGEVSAMV